jgi:hypothetical protein
MYNIRKWFWNNYIGCHLYITGDLLKEVTFSFWMSSVVYCQTCIKRSALICGKEKNGLLRQFLSQSRRGCNGHDRMVVGFNYLHVCNRCLLPLTLWVRTPFMARWPLNTGLTVTVYCTDDILCNYFIWIQPLLRGQLS